MIIPKKKNLVRVTSAKRALKAYNHGARISEEDAIDLVADLCHFIDVNEWNVERILRSGQRHFQAEV